MDWRSSPLIATWWGERRDPIREILRLPLIPPSWAFAAYAALRRSAYQRGARRRVRLPVPTISVGNLTVGGTGKSPTVRWLARHLVAAGRRPLVYSSGAGARSLDREVDEEGAALLRAVPEAAVLQGRDRLALVRAFDVSERPDAVVLDDGFQKHWIARDLDVVMLDATRPFGTGWVVPAGPLRECRQALRQADVVVLSRVDLAGPAATSALGAEVATLAPRALVCTQRHAPRALLVSGAPPESLRGRRVHLLSAIAHPRAFEATVLALCADVTGHSAHRDHAPLSAAAVRDAVLAARARGADLLLCTAKDAPKIGPAALDGFPHDVLDVDVVFGDGGKALTARIAALFAEATDGSAAREP